MVRSLLLSGLTFFFVLCGTKMVAQGDPEWDNTIKTSWPDPFEIVEMTSTQDGKAQKAFIYTSKSLDPKPLIVSLHTWSGDYTQKDPLAKEIWSRDWNYIHPDFRGRNNSPKAMGSPLVISDIEDAIQFALEHTNADPDEVHIIGVSGGGYATLLAYMNVKYPVKSFSAWAPISDIEAWYWESVGRKQKYSEDILQALGSDTIVAKKASERSPIFDDFPVEKRRNSKLYIYEGIHDGYEGSVPITHSINMYNRLVGELKYGLSDLEKIMPKAEADRDLVAESEIIGLLTKRFNPGHEQFPPLFDRKVHLFRKFGNIELSIFEGGHEQIPQALALIPYEASATVKANILTLGDSNAANEGGWVDQLRKMIPESRIINLSRSGRTIGFDNNEREELNGLRRINSLLTEAREKAGGKSFDYVVLNLGTNDTKKVFAERQGEVVKNFEKLLHSITSHKLFREDKPEFIFVTPPPIRTEDIQEKYQGGNTRLATLVPQLREIARQQGFMVLDVFNPLQGVLSYYAPDGIHMMDEGQKIVAERLLDILLAAEVR